MATLDCDRTAVPSELRERFLPQEAPEFELLREHGAVQLWKSKTKPHEVFGVMRATQEHYHLTNAGEISFCFMRSSETAVASFEHEVAHG